jgi:tetratricopeptide (TPR) repeat protein
MFTPRFRQALVGLAAFASLGLSLAANAAEPEDEAQDAEVAVEELGDDAAPAPVEKTRKEEREERLKYATRPHNSRTFAKAREHMEAQRYAEAEKALERLSWSRLNPHERAQAERLYGYIAYGQAKNDVAIERLSESLAEDALPPADQADVLFQIAQIQAVERRWKDTIATLEDWFEIVERPSSVAYFLMALSHYQLEDLDAALLPAKKAVQIAKTPQPAWLQLLLAIHLTRKDYAAATPILDQMIALYPNTGKDYWLQLSALHGVREDQARALAVLEVAYRKGILTDDRDLLRLLQLTLARGIPYRAAEAFETEMAADHFRDDPEALELLSAAWILAREVPKAEEPLARAAELVAKGELYVRLAQIQMLQEEWGEAAATLRKALAKGGLREPAQVQLLLGIAYYNERDLREARTWFAHAQQSGATREQAQTWLEHIDREIDAERAAGTAG